LNRKHSLEHKTLTLLDVPVPVAAVAVRVAAVVAAAELPKSTSSDLPFIV
jgi:hypothetical protein